jgi:hypothetical protein
LLIARSLRITVVLAALLVPAGAAQAASIWTPVNSGTTDTISAIVYQSPSRFWYATTNGKIEYFNGSSFVAGTGPLPGTNFTDLAFQPAAASPGGPGTVGLYGYAVAGDGSVWQSANGGVNWTPLPALVTKHNCDVSAATENVTELNAVVWASGSVVYLLGNNSTMQKSLAGNSATPAFAEINKVGTGTCAAQNETGTQNLTDAVFLAANPLDGFMLDQSFGLVYSTSNAFTSGTHLGTSVNNYNGNPRIAQDAANPNRLWVVDHGAGGAGCGGLCYEVSTDGGTTWSAVQFPQYSAGGAHPTVGLYDVSSQGGAEVAAGSGGEIFTSVDGANVYNQPADGSLASENWRAEDAYDPQHAAVGGESGALVITSQANTIPDIVAPTGTILGSTNVTSGQAVTYTANVTDNSGGSGINPNGYTWTVPGFPAQHGATATYAFPRGTGSVTITLAFSDNAGNQATATLVVNVKDAAVTATPPPSGSHPTTTSTGGGKVTLFKVVTVTGRKGRFVPVIVSSKKGRRFVVTLLTIKGHHHVVPAVSLTLKHGGTRTIHVNLSSKVKTGKYLIVVRLFTLAGHGIGRQITLAFLLV